MTKSLVDHERLKLLNHELSLEKDALRLRKYNKLKRYSPYPKQQEFHAAGASYAERCLGAGNQTGKTLAGSMEMAMHATGKYPDWWEGAVFKRPIVAWVGGHTAETIRDTTQKLLVGRIQDPDGLGTGSIPLEDIIEPVRSLGIKDALDHIKVRHRSGGVSLIFFKSYEKGREKWQGETIDILWPDEEPSPDIYSEGKTRTNNGQLGQMVMLTYTPLLGMTDISHSFYQNPTPAQHLTIMTIEDVDHYTDEEKAAIIAGYPLHEREARANGVPILGSGRVFPLAEEGIRFDPFVIPPHYARLIGCDFGWDHPQGWVSAAYDADEDIVYILNEYKEREQTPEFAAITVKKWHIGEGKWPIPVVWPHDGYQHDKGSGLQLAQQYKDAGLAMHHEHATHSSGGYGTEAGIMEMLDRMRTGRLKVASTCSQWFEEFRLYHRKDGKIVKERDDLMSATRMIIMMLRVAEVPDSYYEEGDYYQSPPRQVGVMGY